MKVTRLDRLSRSVLHLVTLGAEHVRKQVRGQLQPPHALELVHLRQQTLQARGGRVGLQLGEVGTPAARHRALAVRFLGGLVLAAGDQVLQARAGRVREPLHPAAAEPGLEVLDRLAHQPPDLPRGWRLDVVVATPGHHRRHEPIPRQLHRTQLSGQPLLVLLGDRPEPVRRSDFLAVPLDPVALPVVVHPCPGGHLHLLGHILHRCPGHLLGGLREPGLYLEKFEQQGETQPGRSGLVPYLLHVVFEQRPDLDQVFRLPVLPHPCSLAQPVGSPQRRETEPSEDQKNATVARWLLSATCHLVVAIREQGLRGGAPPSGRPRSHRTLPLAAPEPP